MNSRKIDDAMIKRQIESLGAMQPWNHNFELAGGVETRPGTQNSHGKNLVKHERLTQIFEYLEFQSKRVLDVGCNEGYFSIEMAKLGATVTGIDIDVKRLEKAEFIRNVAAEELPVSFRNIDIYSNDFEELGNFDVCLCLGFLHRVPDPFAALAALTERSDIIVLEWKSLKFGPHDDAFAYFSPKPVDKQDFYGTEYWLLSYSAVERILGRLGFKYFYRLDVPKQKRSILVAGKKNHKIFEIPDQVSHRGRVLTLLSHTKRFAKTVWNIMTGKLNA